MRGLKPVKGVKKTVRVKKEAVEEFFDLVVSISDNVARNMLIDKRALNQYRKRITNLIRMLRCT